MSLYGFYPQESKAIVDKCFELGINFFDTAEVIIILSFSLVTKKERVVYPPFVT